MSRSEVGTSAGFRSSWQIASTSCTLPETLDHHILNNGFLMRKIGVYVYPIGSMYGIYANIGGILMVNVTIYSIHGSYGYIYMCVYYDTTGLIRGPHSWTNQCDILYCISIVILGSAIIMRTFESGMHCAVRVLSNEHGLTVRHCLQLFNHIESLNLLSISLLRRERHETQPFRTKWTLDVKN